MRVIFSNKIVCVLYSKIKQSRSGVKLKDEHKILMYRHRYIIHNSLMEKCIRRYREVESGKYFPTRII